MILPDISKTSQLDKCLKVTQYSLKLLNILGFSEKAGKVSRPIAEARVTMRLYDLLIYVLPAIHGKLNKKECLVSSSLLVYYVGEYAYWLIGNGVVKGDAGWWSLVSCRGWLAYLIVELSDITEELRNMDEGEKKERKKMQLLARCCDLVMAVNWSTKNGVFPDVLVQLSGLLSGGIDLFLILSK